MKQRGGAGKTGGLLDRLRHDNRGVVTVAAAVALLIGAAPIFLGAGRAPSAIDTLRSSAWFYRDDGSLVEIDGTTGEQRRRIGPDLLDRDGHPTLLEDGTRVYILEDGEVIVLAGTDGSLVGGGAPIAAGDQLVGNGGSLYAIASDTGRIQHIPKGEVRSDGAVELRREVGIGGVDDNGALWVGDGAGLVFRVAGPRRTRTVDLDAAGPVDAATAGTKAFAVRIEAGTVHEVTGGRARRPIDLGGGGLVVPREPLPPGRLFLARGDELLRVDPVTGDVRTVHLDGAISPPVVAQGQVVVLIDDPGGPQLALIDVDDLSVRVQPAPGLTFDGATVRSRDGLVYVNDPSGDTGYVVDETTVNAVDLASDTEVPTLTPGAGANPPTLAPPARTDDSRPATDGGPALGPDGRTRPGTSGTGPGSGSGDPSGGGPSGPNRPADPGPGGPGDPGDRVDPVDPVDPGACDLSGVDATGIAASWDEGAPGAGRTVSGTWELTGLGAGCAGTIGSFRTTLLVGASGSAEAGSAEGGEVVVGEDQSAAYSGVAAGTYRLRVSLSLGQPALVREQTSAPFVVPPVDEDSVGDVALQVVPGDAFIDASWSSSGAVTDYLVEISPGGRQRTTATSMRFDGLTNGQPYTVTVTPFLDDRAGTPRALTATPQAPTQPPRADSIAVSGGAGVRDYSVSVDTGGTGDTCGFTLASGPTGTQSFTEACSHSGTLPYWATSYTITVVSVAGQPVAPRSGSISTFSAVGYHNDPSNVTYYSSPSGGSPTVIALDGTGDSMRIACIAGGRVRSSHSDHGLPAGVYVDLATLNGVTQPLSSIPPC